jgi:hypothetical protein
MNDEDVVRDELARHLVEALAHLHAEAAAPAGLSDHDVLARLAPLAGLLKQVRVRVVARAQEQHGALFAAWVKALLDRFEATVPPISLERARRDEKE